MAQLMKLVPGENQLSVSGLWTARAHRHSCSLWAGHRHRSHREQRIPCRVQAEQRTDGPSQLQRRIKSAVTEVLPPLRSDPPGQQPPPPPPPPPPEATGSRRGPAAAVAILVAVTYLWWRYYQSLMPELHTDEYGIQYMTTKAGNQVAVAEDGRGRTFFIDKAGNLYYDTGDVNIGAYLVDKDGGVYNIWIDKQEMPQKKYVGLLSDLRTMDIRSLAGIPVRELQREFGGRMDKPFTFFPGQDGLLPPNAPVLKDEDGLVEGPPILDEGAY